jgi:hypothetical protein
MVYDIGMVGFEVGWVLLLLLLLLLGGMGLEQHSTITRGDIHDPRTFLESGTKYEVA